MSMPGEIHASERGDIDVSYEPSTHIRDWKYSGKISHDLIMETHRAVVLDTEYDATVNDLVDLTDVSDMEILPSTLMELNQLSRSIDRAGARRKVAIVTPTDLLYGLAVLYKLMRAEGTDEQIEVFRSRSAARHWIKTGLMFSPA